MFKITGGKGFGITFSNGLCVSVQFGAGNYCGHYGGSFENNAEYGKSGSYDAECAVINQRGDFIRPPDWVDSVNGYMSADEVGKLIAWAMKQDQ